MVCLEARRWDIGDNVGVGDDGIAGVDGEGDGEGGLESGLVEAGESAAGVVGGFELGDGVVAGGGFGEIEAAELVVEDAGEGDVEGVGAGGELLREGEGGLLLGGIEGDGGCFAFGGDGLNLELDGVEGDGAGGRSEGEVDGFDAGEGGGLDVGDETRGA